LIINVEKSAKYQIIWIVIQIGNKKYNVFITSLNQIENLENAHFDVFFSI